MAACKENRCTSIRFKNPNPDPYSEYGSYKTIKYDPMGPIRIQIEILIFGILKCKRRYIPSTGTYGIYLLSYI